MLLFWKKHLSFQVKAGWFRQAVWQRGGNSIDKAEQHKDRGGTEHFVRVSQFGGGTVQWDGGGGEWQVDAGENGQRV